MNDSLSDDEATACFNQIDVWVASKAAPREIWTLGDAVSWAAQQPIDARITLFRPPGGAGKPAWIRSNPEARHARVLRALRVRRIADASVRPRTGQSLLPIGRTSVQGRLC